jgi:tetratricopeptide (TPR) repeat protein
MRASRILPLLAILALCGFAIGCSRAQWSRAQQYEMAGKYATALELYQQVLAETPGPAARRAEVLDRIGECQYHIDRMQEAFNSFQKAAEANPDDVNARLRMGQMLLEAGSPDRAREQAAIILKRTPENTEALAMLGAAWSATGNFDLAKQAYGRVLQNDPKRTKVAVALADIYNREDKEAAAAETLKNAAAADPSSSAPWLAMARLAEQQGDARAAEDAYRKAIAVEDTPETNLRLSQFLQRSARITEAEQVLRKVDSQEPKDSVALADFQLLSGRPDDALAQYRQALTAAAPADTAHRRWSFSFLPNSISTKGSSQSATDHSDETSIAARLVEAEIFAASRLHGAPRKQAMAGVRSRLQENRARFDAATIQILEAETAMADDNLALAHLYANAAIELAPNSPPAHYVAGLAAVSGGDNDTAELEWQNALDQDGHFGPARLALAEAALSRGDGDNADEQARIVVRDNPGDLQAILVFARALLLEGKVVPAAIMAQRASALDPISPEPALILGGVALKTNHAPQALMQFERALALRPDSDEAIEGMLHVYQAGRISYASIKKMEDVAQQPPVSSTLLEVAGRLYASHGWYTDAIRALRATIATDPLRVTAARSLALLQASTGDQAGATDSAAKAGIDAQPLLNAYREQSSGDWKKAVAIYERALREGDQSGVAANNVAWLYAEHDAELDRALSLAETAAHASPNDPAVLDTLGFVHLRRREYSDAVKLLQAAARISEELGVAPERAELNQQIRKHLSEAYMCSGQTAEAMKLAQKRDLLPPH